MTRRPAIIGKRGLSPSGSPLASAIAGWNENDMRNIRGLLKAGWNENYMRNIRGLLKAGWNENDMRNFRGLLKADWNENYMRNFRCLLKAGYHRQEYKTTRWQDVLQLATQSQPTGANYPPPTNSPIPANFKPGPSRPQGTEAV